MVQGLGFGDEGKGTMVDYLARTKNPGVVIRYNGGAQAAHNVVTPDGKHHTFSQWGSGTLAGVETHLSKHVMIDPLSMVPEAKHLEEIGISDPWTMLSVDPDAPLITPYHRVINRIREGSRGAGRHGSVGIGECMSDLLKHGRLVVPTAGDLNKPTLFVEKLMAIQYFAKQKLDEMNSSNFHKLPAGLFELLDTDPYKIWQRYENVRYMVNVEETSELLEAICHRAGMGALFEGAQGVLLHQDYGFHPHTTWSDTSFTNAYQILAEAGFHDAELERIGVVRSYMTRHGAGPMPTELVGQAWAQAFNRHDHNQPSEHTGSMRVGYLDLPLLMYSLDVIGKLEGLAVTHLDKQLPQVCTRYACGMKDSQHFDPVTDKIWVNAYSHDPLLEEGHLQLQQELGDMLKKRVIPLFEDIDAITALKRLSRPILYESHGPTWKHKKETEKTS